MASYLISLSLNSYIHPNLVRDIQVACKRIHWLQDRRFSGVRQRRKPMADGRNPENKPVGFAREFGVVREV
jgi:hypothetical protein